MLRRVWRVYKTHGLGGVSTSSVDFLRHGLEKPILFLNNAHFNSKYSRGESVLDFDWDNLLLLDACRYDEFVKHSPFPEDEIEPRITVASKTPGFLRETFSHTQLHDTVYVTANPQVLRFRAEHAHSPRFHDVISLLDEWDAETQTVLPETVKNAALEAEETHPEKRLIIHFLQPHAPFLGDKARKIREQTGKTIGGVNPGRDYTYQEPKDIVTTGYRMMLEEHDITAQDIITAYRESLREVVTHAGELAKRLEGKSAMTADHGELLGERIHPLSRRRWEHPAGVRTPELCKVPWVEFHANQRKTVTDDPPVDHDTFNRRTVEQRLQSLGYTR